MKTISEYAPLIFSQLADHARKTTQQRKRLWIDGLALAGYGVLGLWLSLDTGFAPWQWQFWVMFGPFFVAGEMAIRALHASR